MTDTLSALALALRRLVDDGGDGNRLLLEADTGYLIVHGRRGDLEVEVEAAAGRHVPGGGQLADEAHQRLHEEGFRRRSAADNYLRRQPLGDAAALAAQLVALLAAVYSPTPPPRLALHLGDRETAENPALLRAMEHLSRTRDMGARHAVYLALLQGRLLLALEQPADAPGLGADLKLRAVETLQGATVAAVFTDWRSLRRFEPRGLPYAALSGMEVFPLLAVRRVGSVLINPRGQIGGELYRNEILTISDGARRLSGVH